MRARRWGDRGGTPATTPAIVIVPPPAERSTRESPAWGVPTCPAASTIHRDGSWRARRRRRQGGDHRCRRARGGAALRAWSAPGIRLQPATGGWKARAVLGTALPRGAQPPPRLRRAAL